MIVDMMFSAFEADLRSRRVSATSLREFRIVSTRFREYLQEHALDAGDVRRPHIQDFFASSGWSPATQHARLTWLRSPYLYAVEELELLDRNPCQRVRLERAPKIEVRVITALDLRAARDNARTEVEAAIFALFAFTGMRISEVTGLEWANVSFGDATLGFVRKGGGFSTIPMHPEVAKSLRQLGVWRAASPYVLPGRGGPMSRQGLHKRVKRLLPEPYSAHDFRHTVASSLEHNGAREAAIFAIMGWSPDASLRLRHYTALPMPVLYRELLKLYADDPL